MRSKKPARKRASDKRPSTALPPPNLASKRTTGAQNTKQPPPEPQTVTATGRMPSNFMAKWNAGVYSDLEAASEPADATDSQGQTVEQEAAEFFLRRPIYCAIADRLCQLAREMSQLRDGTPSRKRLKQRCAKLERYLDPKPQDDGPVLAWAHSLIYGQIGKQQQRITSWEEVKRLTDGFAQYLRARPVGHPNWYRHRITEALERKLASPQRTWPQIAGELRIPLQDLNRQVRLLKKLLRNEGILIPEHHRPC